MGSTKAMMYDIKPNGIGRWKVSKLDADCEAVQTYTVTMLNHRLVCHDCAASEAKTCRHRAMVLAYETNPFWKGRFARGWKWDHDNSRWIPPSAAVTQILGER